LLSSIKYSASPENSKNKATFFTHSRQQHDGKYDETRVRGKAQRDGRSPLLYIDAELSWQHAKIWLPWQHGSVRVVFE